MKKTMLFAMATLGLMLAGCTSFEQTAYTTLAATTGVLNQAQIDYEAKTIPQTQAAFTAITKAKAAEVLAVQAMVTYEELKATKGTTTAQLSAQQQVVTTLLADLPTFIADVKALYTTTKTGPLQVTGTPIPAPPTAVTH